MSIAGALGELATVVEAAGSFQQVERIPMEEIPFASRTIRFFTLRDVGLKNVVYTGLEHNRWETRKFEIRIRYLPGAALQDIHEALRTDESTLVKALIDASNWSGSSHIKAVLAEHGSSLDDVDDNAWYLTIGIDVIVGV